MKLIAQSFLGALTLASSAVRSPEKASKPRLQPNIVSVLVDDLGWTVVET